MTTRSAPKTALKGAKVKTVKSKNIKPKQEIRLKLERPKGSQKPAWLWHGVLDLSLEARPLLRPLKVGERTMDYLVQAHHAALPQQGVTQLTLRLRTQITAADGPLVLAEMHYSGMIDIQQNAETLGDFFAELYPLARSALLATLAQVGHMPPLPEHFHELNQE
jgi:hypothetical protein